MENCIDTCWQKCPPSFNTTKRPLLIRYTIRGTEAPIEFSSRLDPRPKRECVNYFVGIDRARQRERERVYIYLVVGGSGLIKLAGRRWRCWKQKGEPLSQAAKKLDENGGNGNRSLISNLRIVLWTSAAKGKTEGTDSFLLITHFLIKSSVTLMDDVHRTPKGLYVFIMQRTRALCSRVARNHKSQSAINFKFGSIVTLFQQPHLLPQQYTSSLIS